MPVQSNEGSSCDEVDICENAALPRVFTRVERLDRLLVLLTGEGHLHEGKLCSGLVFRLNPGRADRAVKKPSGFGFLSQLGR